jgi:hypothetical protein
VSQLRQREDELAERNVEVLVITFQAGYFERAYVEETGLQWPLLSDESRALYRAYGMERGRLWDIFGPRSIGTYLKLLLGGRRLKAATGDPRQLGGDVLIDPLGVVRLHHVGSGPADRPSVDRLLAVVQSSGTGP